MFNQDCLLPAMDVAKHFNRYLVLRILACYDQAVRGKNNLEVTWSLTRCSVGFVNCVDFNHCSITCAEPVPLHQPFVIDLRCGNLSSLLGALQVPLLPGGVFVRPHKLVGSPHTLPVDLPSVDLLELIFNDFRCNFRTFESWNLQQRRKTLSAVMRTDIRKAFQSLKEEAPTCPERFVHSTSAQIVDVDPVANLVHIDQPLCPSKQVTWTLDDVPVQVRALDHQLFEVRSSLPLMPGQELIMHSQLTCIADMQESLKSFWSARWQKYENISVDRWDRLIGFVRAYMPTLQFQLPAITGPMWDQ